MVHNRPFQRGATVNPDPGMGRMMLLSLGLHVAVVLLFAGVLLPRFHRQPPPVYYVDLVNLPVPEPQAGRPDARPEPQIKPEAKPAPAPKTENPQPEPQAEPVKPPEPEPKVVIPVKPPEPQPKVVAPARPEPKPKPAVEPPKAQPKPKPQPAKKAPPVRPEKQLQEQYKGALEKMEKMRREQEIADLKKKLAVLAADDSRNQPSATEAPVGMPTGKGTQAGSDEQVWIQGFLKKNWNLSKYQVTRRDLKASTRITYNAEGALLNYQILTPSGDAVFDDSVRAAILRASPLPFRPKRRLEIDVEFNLKDLLE